MFASFLFQSSPHIPTLRLEIIKFYGLIAATAWLLGGCATSNIGNQYRLEDHPNDGLVVVSVSFEGLSDQVSPVWEYRSLDGNLEGKIFTSALNALDWKNPPGRLAVFVLPAGHYQFDRCRFVRLQGAGGMGWHLSGSGGVTNSNPAYSGFNAGSTDEGVADPFAVKFEVLPGRVTYIGNMHLRWGFGTDTKEHGIVESRELSERDLPLLINRYPNIRKEDILFSRLSPP